MVPMDSGGDPAESYIMKVRAKILVAGIVQGVGFRPFIYQLAHSLHLNGYVANTSKGVDIEVEGSRSHIEDFISKIRSQKPPLAQITDINVSYLPLNSYKSFSIKKSAKGELRTALISPDVSICKDCLKELFDPDDRRYKYPFINCTNCGPRYTIINNIPYDRKYTSMAGFKMCARCQAEYEDPLNRRFHAQPNACWDCGPRVNLLDASGNAVSCDDAIKKTINLLHQGLIIAIKGLGGFHLAVDATNSAAVERLRQRKLREEKPLAIMSHDLEAIARYAIFDADESELLNSYRRPIVLLKKRIPNKIAPEVAPGNNYFGVMLPYAPLHYLIFQGDFLALVMTSGNLSEEPIAIENHEALQRLKDIADYFLVHNRDIYLRSDDSVARIMNKRPFLLRRSRGYTPQPIILNKAMKQILACGAEDKNTICLTKGKNAFISQHIGDMENLETYTFFGMTIEHLKKLMEIEPEIIAHDLHPDYLSTQYALKQKGYRLEGIQHHHAHIASCMAENKIENKVIGLALDGTGYGLDGHIWGGEVLIADYMNAERIAHFQYTPMPGGAAAVKEPWRMAASYLLKSFGSDAFSLDIEFIRRIGEEKLNIMNQIITKGINSPLASSCGRLFDGIASLIGIRDINTYSGQAAMELEMAIENERSLQAYDTEKVEENGMMIIQIESLMHQIVNDIKKKTSPGTISLKFHNALVEVFTRLCLEIKEQSGLNAVAFGGGVFQNRFLSLRLQKSLESKGFTVYTHSLVPTNDGGISLGQVLIADRRCA
jgi:hydrogenase maturation protein HypF